MNTLAAFEFDPYSPALHQDPFPLYKRLRDEQPVFHNEKLDFYALSRWGDVHEAVNDTETYCSSLGVAVGMPPGPPSDVPMLIMMDPPRHTQLRTLVSRAFTPRRIAELEPRIREIARELIDSFEGDRVDLVGDFAAQLPTIVIAELLGVPTSDREMFRDKSMQMATFDPLKLQGAGSELSPVVDLGMYMSEVFAERRARPRDDLISALIAARVDGESLTLQEQIGFAMLLLVAGNETTTDLISNAVVLLDRHPGEREKLVKDPAGVATAVEEFLRYEGPVQGLARTTTREVTLHGVEIPAGEKVLLLFASANRDERHTSEPDRFDVCRNPNPHLAFGFGAHFCMGASLARLETQIAFEELLRRFPRYALADERIERICSGPLRGCVSLPTALEGR